MGGNIRGGNFLMGIFREKFSRGKFDGWKFSGCEFSEYLLKELKVIFVSATKIGESTIIILQMMFFSKNLQFFKLNQVSTYRKLNLPFTNSTYFVFLPVEM